MADVFGNAMGIKWYDYAAEEEVEEVEIPMDLDDMPDMPEEEEEPAARVSLTWFDNETGGFKPVEEWFPATAEKIEKGLSGKNRDLPVLERVEELATEMRDQISEGGQAWEELEFQLNQVIAMIEYYRDNRARIRRSNNGRKNGGARGSPRGPDSGG